MKKEIQQELEEFSPFLSKIGKDKEGFRVPQHYFPTLADDVIKKIKLEEAAKNRSEKTVLMPQSTWSAFWASLLRPQFRLGLATFALLIGSIFLLSKKETRSVAAAMPSTNTVNLEYASNAVTNDDIHSYIQNNLEDFEEEQISALGANGEEEADAIQTQNDDELDSFLNDMLQDNEMDEAKLQELM